MGIFATIVFVFALCGIISLFALKAWEVRHTTTFVPAWRARADQRALEFKTRLLHSREEISKVVPFLMLLSRYFIHEAALGVAVAAHFAGVQAHRFADFVSHKHHFERQAPRSEFLKQVAQITERPTLAADPITSTVTVEAVRGSAEPKREVSTVVRTTHGLVSEVTAAIPEKIRTKQRTSKKKKPRIAAPSLKHGITNHFYDEM